VEPPVGADFRRRQSHIGLTETLSDALVIAAPLAQSALLLAPLLDRGRPTTRSAFAYAPAVLDSFLFSSSSC
jgi:hypothetical protein